MVGEWRIVTNPTYLEYLTGVPRLKGACRLIDELFAALLCMEGQKGAPYAAIVWNESCVGLAFGLARFRNVSRAVKELQR